jgi:hypothetical protein
VYWFTTTSPIVWILEIVVVFGEVVAWLVLAIAVEVLGDDITTPGEGVALERVVVAFGDDTPVGVVLGGGAGSCPSG